MQKQVQSVCYRNMIQLVLVVHQQTALGSNPALFCRGGLGRKVWLQNIRILVPCGRKLTMSCVSGTCLPNGFFFALIKCHMLLYLLGFGDWNTFFFLWRDLNTAGVETLPESALRRLWLLWTEQSIVSVSSVHMTGKCSTRITQMQIADFLWHGKTGLVTKSISLQALPWPQVWQPPWPSLTCWRLVMASSAWTMCMEVSLSSDAEEDMLQHYPGVEIGRFWKWKLFEFRFDAAWFCHLQGTNRYFQRIAKEVGLEVSFADCTKPELLKQALKDNTKVGKRQRYKKVVTQMSLKINKSGTQGCLFKSCFTCLAQDWVCHRESAFVDPLFVSLPLLWDSI